MLSHHRYLSIVKLSAGYDLLVTLPFATPWSFALLYGLLQYLHQYFQLGGELSPLNPATMLFANLLGSVVCVWSLARLLAPSLLMGRLDALARLLFASWQLWAWKQGVSDLILWFTAVEIGFGIAQMLPPGGLQSLHRTTPLKPDGI